MNKRYNLTSVISMLILAFTFGSVNAQNTVTDNDGNEYSTVVIGDRVWMTENLRVKTFNNGDPIPYVKTDSAWAVDSRDNSQPVYTFFKNDSTIIETFGYMYNYFVLTDSRGIVPEGWRVPTEEDWKALETAAGMPEADLDRNDWAGLAENVAGKLQSTDTTHWEPNANATQTNELGFNWIGGSIRYAYGAFEGAASLLRFSSIWSIDEDAENNANVWRRLVRYDRSEVRRHPVPKGTGMTVRLVKDFQSEPESAAPAPTEDAGEVLSIFSDTYTSVADTDFNPNWGQGTVFSTVEVATGDTLLKYESLNYQGTEFANPLDVSAYGSIHIDMWTATTDTVQFFLINPGEPPIETPYSLAGVAGQWVGFDIPLTEFTPVDLTAVGQFKVDDGDRGTAPTVFFDNLYFYGTSTNSEITEAPSGFSLEQNYPNPFNPSTNISYSLPASGEVTLEVFNLQGQKVVTLVDGFKAAGAHTATFDATSLASGVYIYRLFSGANVQVKKMMLIK